MSADNGYILRKRAADNQFVLQMYFASNDSYPSINDDRAMTFDNVEEALAKYEEINREYYSSEYGLTVQIDQPV